MAAAGAGGGGSGEGSAKATVSEEISQAVQSTSNLLQLMQQSSLSQVIEQMPRVISALDAHMESGLHSLFPLSVPHLKMVIQLLSNMDSCQLNSASHTHQIPQAGWREREYDKSVYQSLPWVRLVCPWCNTLVCSTCSSRYLLDGVDCLY